MMLVKNEKLIILVFLGSADIACRFLFIIPDNGPSCDYVIVQVFTFALSAENELLQNTDTIIKNFLKKINY